MSSCREAEVNPNPATAYLAWPFALTCEPLLYDNSVFKDYDAHPSASYQVNSNYLNKNYISLQANKIKFTFEIQIMVLLFVCCSKLDLT